MSPDLIVLNIHLAVLTTLCALNLRNRAQPTSSENPVVRQITGDDRDEIQFREEFERKVLRALANWQAAHPGEWITSGRFRNNIAKRWPEVNIEQGRDRTLLLQRTLESLAERGRLRQRNTRGGRGHEFKVPSE